MNADVRGCLCVCVCVCPNPRATQMNEWRINYKLKISMYRASKRPKWRIVFLSMCAPPNRVCVTYSKPFKSIYRTFFSLIQSINLYVSLQKEYSGKNLIFFFLDSQALWWCSFEANVNGICERFVTISKLVGSNILTRD